MIPSVDNVLRVYRSASASHIWHGLTWYAEANAFAKSLDPHNVERAAGIIAALSPLSGWENNQNKATQLYAQSGRVCISENGGNGIGLWTNVSKAQKIYAGAAPLDVLRGDKVRAFFETIVNPFSHETTPVVDRHAFDVAIGKRTDNDTRKILDRKGVYAEFAAVYSEAARVVNIGSAQIQAVTWVAWRDMIKDKVIA